MSILRIALVLAACVGLGMSAVQTKQFTVQANGDLGGAILPSTILHQTSHGSTTSVQLTNGPNPTFQISHGEDGSGTQSDDSAVFAIDGAGNMECAGNVKSEGAMKNVGALTVNGVAQWQLAVLEEDFSSGGVSGWSNTTTSVCGGRHLLGGFNKFGPGAVSKTYASLPEHTEVKVEASVTFIDDWKGETLWLKVGEPGAYVWTHSVSRADNPTASTCGNVDFAEPELGKLVSVVWEHTGALKLEFGSTLDQTQAWWGIDGIKIYTRKQE